MIPSVPARDSPSREGTLNQITKRERVKGRIRALVERTTSNGCTEAEALAAAEMAGRLLERYALTMEEVDLRAEPCIRREIPCPAAQRPLRLRAGRGARRLPLRRDQNLAASLMEEYFRGARQRLLRAHRRGLESSARGER